MGRRLLGIFLVLTTVLALVASCASPAATPAPTQAAAAGSKAAAKKVAGLFPGLVNDQSWNQQGYDGLKQAEKEGVQIAYTEKVSQDQQIEVFRNYARQGYNVVVGWGGEYMDAGEQVAKEFPNANIVVVNGVKGNGSNLTSLQLNYFDQGYLAAVLAGLMSQTKKIAIVGGQEIPITVDAIKGYKAGAARVSPSIEVKSTITGSWDDVDKAREAAMALISGGADVLFPVLDAADAGVYAAAEDKGKMTMGLFADQSKLAPKAHIAAVLVNATRAMYLAATGPLDGKMSRIGADKGVVSMGAFAKSVPQSVIDQVKTAEDDLKNGKVQQ